jgi:hypothetical protein
MKEQQRQQTVRNKTSSFIFVIQAQHDYVLHISGKHHGNSANEEKTPHIHATNPAQTCIEQGEHGFHQTMKITINGCH